MAPKKVVPKTIRTVALGMAARNELESAVCTLDEARGALRRWADELEIDAESAHQSAVGVQAEAIRLAICALSAQRPSAWRSLLN